MIWPCIFILTIEDWRFAKKCMYAVDDYIWVTVAFADVQAEVLKLLHVLVEVNC